MTVIFTHENEIFDADVIAILDDGETVAIEITDSAWTGRRDGWEIDTADLRPRCECGNPFRLCHPDA